MPTFTNRLKHAWNAFRNNRDPTEEAQQVWASTFISGGSAYRPDRVRLSRGRERSIVTAIYNRIAIDVAGHTIAHVRTDENGRYIETINSGLNNVLSIEANKDQTGRAFIQDVVMSLLDEGSCAIVPTDTSINPKHGSFDVLTARTGKILAWYPDHVRLQVYNDNNGNREEIVMPKKAVAILENPLYAVMNEPNSVLQRLIRKLNLLDAIDEQSGSGKLDLLIQLPYLIKSQARKEQAEMRRKELENQLAGSKYGVAYTDGTEKVIQLNRSVENNLLDQVKYLTDMLYNQLGMTESILNGSANEQEQLNYLNRTIEPFLATIASELERKFLTKTARTQHQKIIYFHDPFKLVPVNNIADIADKLTRNEVLSSNEVRGIIGFKPSDDPKADELRNKNLNPEAGSVPMADRPMPPEEEADTDVSELDSVELGQEYLRLLEEEDA